MFLTNLTHTGILVVHHVPASSSILCRLVTSKSLVISESSLACGWVTQLDLVCNSFLVLSKERKKEKKSRQSLMSSWSLLSIYFGDATKAQETVRLSQAQLCAFKLVAGCLVECTLICSSKMAERIVGDFPHSWNYATPAENFPGSRTWLVFKFSQCPIIGAFHHVTTCFEKLS